MSSTFAIAVIALLLVCANAKDEKTLRSNYSLGLPLTNVIGTCKNANPCVYNIPSGWMVTFTLPQSKNAKIFTVTSLSGGSYYVDYGPDTHHYFSGTCCNFASKDEALAAACVVESTRQWNYRGSCSMACATEIAVWNRNSDGIQVQITASGDGPM
jgi:hypothetical protein